MSNGEHCGACEQACAPEGDCRASVCTCPGLLVACGSSCVDVQLDEQHCGACDAPCVDTQTCDSGVCQCPAGQDLCGTECVDLQSDAEHCSGCGQACADRQVCTAGACACPGTEIVCGNGCVDTQTSGLHCGGCDNPCTGGQICEAGGCACPEGSELCAGQCIDTRSDNDNCGGCDDACGLGEGCSDGACERGAPGEDGCQGLAQNLDIAQIAAYQTVKTELARDGVGVADRGIDVVAGRPTLLRVFVEPGPGWVARELSARLHLENGETVVTQYAESTLGIAAASQEGNRETAFEFQVPAERITGQTRYAVEVVECTQGVGETSSPRFPETDGVALDAIDAGGLRVHIIPVRANGRVPDTSEQALAVYEREFLAMYPISSIDFTVGDPVDIANAQDWNLTLETVRALRQSEQPDPEVYYYGMVRPSERLRDFCMGGCTAGVGYVPGGNGNPAARAAVGLAYGDVGSAFTMLHEVAHNHGRGHAPCVPMGSTIQGVDDAYPYAGANIGVYGYSALEDQLFTPDGATDLMGYCDDQWVSDYTYQGLLSTVLAVNRVQASLYVSPERLGAWRVVLIDPAHGARWGFPIPGPALASGTEEAALALDAAGAAIESVTVYRTEVADLDAFSVQVPEPKPGWHSIAVAGAPPIAYR